MQIPLNQFEQYIDETILKRGLAYFKNGQVNDPEEVSPNQYEAIVEGTEDYTVQLSIKNGVIVEHSCNCPYDAGPVCKHLAAVIFYFQEDELEINKKTNPLKAEKTPKTAKLKNASQQLDELLKKISHEELIQFVREKTATNPSFKNLFLTSFAQYNSDESKEFYVKQVKSIIKIATDSQGFINWSSSIKVRNGVEGLLESAQKQIENRSYKSVIFICTALMEQLMNALQFADDSNGDIGGSIGEAFELLSSIVQKNPPEEIRKQILQYCFTAFDNKIYVGWDWHMDILKLASELVKNENEVAYIFTQIDKTNNSDYDKEYAQAIKYEILLKTKGENIAFDYIEQNITNSELRRKAIQLMLNQKKYDRAITFAIDGVNFDLARRPGLAKEWYDWLLKIAQAQNDSEKTIEYARLLFIDNFRNEQDYYQILKQNIAPEKWNEFVEGMLHDILSQKRWTDTSLMASIFIKEEWWERLLDLVKKTPELNVIDQYGKYLVKNYAQELIELYANGVLKYLKNSMGRDHYKNACKYIRKIIKLGSRKKANEIITYLQIEYPKRKALMEELNQI
jgi:uncharacterized Zn finger protein